MQYVISALIGYLLGSINTSIILSRLKGEDIRTKGSGNAGATNTLRVFGKSAAALVLLFDFLKGIAAVLIIRFVFQNTLCEYLAAGFVILGHNFPVYFGFKGGKGVLTSLSVILIFCWWQGLAVLVSAVSVMAITRYVSLGSMVGAVVHVIICLFRGDIGYTIFSVIIASLLIIRHRSNIVRLVKGTESKLGEKKNEQ